MIKKFTKMILLIRKIKIRTYYIPRTAITVKMMREVAVKKKKRKVTIMIKMMMKMMISYQELRSRSR